MDKKGTHIDWVVSIALFMTFMIILLGFIKPGYSPKFEGDVLIKMIKEEFNNKVGWNVTKTLLSFYGEECNKQGYVDFTLKDYVPESEEGFRVWDRGGGLAFYTGSLKIRVDPALNKDKFWVISGPGLGVGDNPFEESLGEIKCEIGAANPIVFRGINQNQLVLEKLKIEEWGFPEFRYFRIQIRDQEGDVKKCFSKILGGVYSGLNENCRDFPIPDEVEVYSANFGTTILDKDLVTEQVILNMEVW